MDERADLGRPVGIRGLPCRAGSGGACFGDLRRSGGEGMTRRSASPSRADRPASRNGEERSKSDLQADQRLGPDGGLSSAEAAARLERYGPNTLEERHRGVALELLSHFWQPIPWMIEAALVLTAVTARWTDFGVILDRKS